MRIVAETPLKNQCVQHFIETYRRLSPPLQIDGQHIYATWEDWSEDGQSKIQYEAEVDLANNTILIYYYDGKRKRKLCKSRISTFDAQFFQGLMYPGKKKVYLRHTKCVTDSLCLVPVHYGGYPALAVAMREEKLVRLVPSWTIGDVVYFADTNVDLSPPLPDEYNEEELKKAVREVAKYGAEIGVLALLPYIQMHAIKRYVPVVVGPMRSGKTSTLMYIYSAWPQPKKYVSMPSTASLRDSLVRSHVAADDVGEDPDRPFNWRIVIPYFERGVVSRLKVQTMREVAYVLHGALVIATNAPSDDIRSVQDRIRYIRGDRVPPGAETEPHPQLSWLAFNPFLYMAVPPWLSAIDAAMALLFGESPPPPQPQHDLMNEPYMAFVAQLYYKLARLYAVSDNPCGDPERGQPPSKHFKLVGERGYIVFQLKSFENPLYGDRRVTITRSVTLRDVKTVTTSISRTSIHYSVTEARLIIERFNLPIEILLFEKNYYIAIPCEKLEETYMKLKTIVK